MSKEINIAAQQKLGEAAANQNYDLFTELIAENCIDHDPAPGQVQGPEGFITLFKTMHAAFPDMKSTVEQLSSDEDTISFAYTVTATHKGEYMGVPATGIPVRFRGMQISKFKDGKLAERWGSSDELGILKQIGAIINLVD